MSEIDSGGPMFPSDKTEWVPYDIPAKGITIRQWFAGMALQGLLDNLTIRFLRHGRYL